MSPLRPALPPALYHLLRLAIRDTPGQEICGLLVAHGEQLSFRRLPNLGGPGEFWVEETALERQLAHTAASGGCIRGFVHSHTTGTHLSALDACAVATSRWPWLVVAVVGGTLAGQWHWPEGNQVRSETMVRAAPLVAEGRE